ncbi:tRNA (N(6)-L-threonylcarbamoyladenosine(37)-C(2))-methylthiotransferase MtaB [Blattabacterium cuenoti]|uniref:tRNA (N(6)-L-threonylcarbamoyladenosine(37)-C(2))- methylthiotransferase MtaB n=1 Tax=Blattabacterium cuenoti TaxID=1653831 RepID=UPI00163B931F|nr:tRNA (N(6)-L-threonylcarbamoyladenosine(37)-C(2))-methylthiotransferase MtaB [Blattabacterium cuenoti]
MRKKIAFYTIGCKLNYAETSTIARKFSSLYYKHVSFKNHADIYVINSCSVTNNAELEFKRAVRSAVNRNYKAIIIAMGCYAQLNPEKVSSINGVDLVLGYEEKFKILDYLNEKIFLKKRIISNYKNNSYFPSFSIGYRTRSFLKIQDGCDYKCSYCIIPSSRGPSRSDSVENILNSINFLFKKGVKEIVLTGVNIGCYKTTNNLDKNYTFLDLIRIIEDKIKVRGRERIRLTSIEPNLLKRECIELLSNSKCFAPHFHISLQSGSNEILRKMRRRYRRELYKEKINQIRHHIPHAYIGSDLIVGFPGETHQHFLETYHFLNKLNISYMHIFTYSPRPNTTSIAIPGNISKSIKKKRNKVLRLLSNKKYRFFCENHLFTKKTVLFEKNDSGKKYLYGYTENYIRTKIKFNINFENTLQDVLLTEIDKDGIVIVKPILE